MIVKTFGAFLVLLLLACVSACAQIPARTKAVNATGNAESAKSAKTEEDAQAKLPSQDVKLPPQNLTAPMLFDSLLGETALQRGDPAIATRTYLKLARTTRDPRVAQRATEIALHARQPGVALEAANIWMELDPDSITARQTLAALLVNADRLDEARPQLEKLLASDEGNIHEAFMQLNSLLARNPNKAAIFELVKQLAQPYPELPEARFAVSQAAWFADYFNIALAEMKAALALRPDWEVAAIFQGRILARTSTADAIYFYQDYLTEYPEAHDVRITYARLLLAGKEYIKARNQFQQLLAANPENADVALAIGLLSLELREYDTAESNFKRALALDYRDPGMARFYLANIYEKTGRIEPAMEWYRSVTTGIQYVPAQIRYAFLLKEKGDTEEALRYLQQLPVMDDQQRAQLIIAEAQLLREKGEYQKVFHLLSNGLERVPDYPDLLYDRALAAEKIGKSDIMEKDLLKLIQLKPDHAHAYNALGYGLAEHGKRLPEALELIEKAIVLSPNDPYIMDSLGWVHHRMGNLNQALSYLRQAFSINPDPEIAAHLGEILWVQELKEEAKKVWQSALRNHPDNELLIGTMNKFMK